MSKLFTVALACLSLSGCAVFKPMPTAVECMKAMSLLADAHGALDIANAALDAAMASGANAETLARIRIDVGIARTTVGIIQGLVDSKCGTP